jgi:hypothetical protein
MFMFDSNLVGDFVCCKFFVRTYLFAVLVVFGVCKSMDFVQDYEKLIA